MRVLHLPTTAGGHSSGISRQLRLLGIDSRVWTITQTYLDYPVDRVLTSEKDGGLIRMLKVLWAGRYVFGRWDVIHYNFGSTLFSKRYPAAGRRGIPRLATGVLNVVGSALQRLELGILRARRIPVFVYYQGDDARQGDYSLEHYEVSIATQVPPDYYTPETDEIKRRQIALMSRYAAAIYAVNPDLLNVLPSSAEFVPYGHVDLEEFQPEYTQADRDRLVFVHAPSDRNVKGTTLILDALAELASEGYGFEIDLVEGVSNAEALERYRNADVVIDQLYAGWYGGFALEAMALGKPVVAYLRESDFRHLPSRMATDLPFLQATPATIKEDLRRILEMPRDELVERARRSRAFVERWHDPGAIASKTALDYRRELRTARGEKGGAS